MKKLILLVFISSLIGNVSAQIGIHTPHPKAIFHVDGAKDNPKDPLQVVGSGEQLNDFSVNESGQVGVGIITPVSSASVEINIPKGLRIPQIDQTRIDYLTTIVNLSAQNKALGEGLIVYNTTSKQIEFFNGTNWVTL